MKIELLCPDLQNDYIFRIKEGDTTYLSSADFAKKSACLAQLQEVLVNLRDNEQIAIQSGNNNQYYFEVASFAQSPSFEDIEAASDVLAKLKYFVTQQSQFTVLFDKPSTQVVSKKQLGLREELYDFSRNSTVGKEGFELINVKGSNHRFFHFNDKKGEPILFSRAFDGKTKRIKAIRNIIKNAKNEERFELVHGNGQFSFILKTSKGFEIARSKQFDSQAKMEQAIAYLRSTAPKFKNDFKIDKKRQKKKLKAKEKYHLKQIAPLGLVGFEGFKSKKNKLHYFHYHDEVGQALLISKPYPKRSERDAGIAYIIKNGTKKKYYKTWKKSKNQYYFSFINKNEKSFARSRYFKSENEMLAALQHLKEHVSGYEQEVNVVPITKQKKYTVILPTKATDDVPKAAIAVSAATLAPTIEPVMTEEVSVAKEEISADVEAIDLNQPDVLPDILPKSGIIIEQEPISEGVSLPDPTPPVPEPVFTPNTTSIQKEIIEAKPSSGFPWRWLLLALPLLLLLFLLMKTCGTNATEQLPPPPPPKVVEKPRPETVAPAKLGPTALELNLTPLTAEAKIADFLSTPEVVLPKTFILESVQFPFNSAILTNTSHEQLNNVVNVLQEYPKAKIRINGHTDSRGKEAMNQVLSENRAIAVQKYLINKGINSNRILNAIGFGETAPIATNDTNEGQQKNRRSEIEVVER